MNLNLNLDAVLLHGWLLAGFLATGSIWFLVAGLGIVVLSLVVR